MYFWLVRTLAETRCCGYFTREPLRQFGHKSKLLFIAEALTFTVWQNKELKAFIPADPVISHSLSEGHDYWTIQVTDNWSCFLKDCRVQSLLLRIFCLCDHKRWLTDGHWDGNWRKRLQRPYTPLMISGTPVERVSSFKYLGVNISEDLTWTAHIQTQVKKARQRLYHLRQLRTFRVSPAILKTFYSGAIESVLTQCISVWYGNVSNQDRKALQRVVCA